MANMRRRPPTRAELKKKAPAYPGEDTGPHKVGPKDDGELDGDDMSDEEALQAQRERLLPKEDMKKANMLRKARNRLLRVQDDWNRAVAAYDKVTEGKKPTTRIMFNLSAPKTGEWVPTGKPILRTVQVAEAAKEWMETRLPTNTEGRSGDSLTKLTQKQHSPMVIRKVTAFGFPIYVALISDCNLDPLDRTVIGFVRKHIGRWKSDSLQDKRNLAGDLNDHLQEWFPNTESVAVIFYIDKAFVSSLHGDFMNHTSCRIELFSLLAMSPHV